NVRLDIYGEKYAPGNPCNDLLKSNMSSDWDTLRNLPQQTFYIFVVSSTVQVSDPIQFNIEFGREVGRVSEKCLYSCEQRDDVHSKLFPYEPLDIQISGSYQLNEEVSIRAGECSEYARGNHHFTGQDTAFTVQSLYIHKQKFIETIFDLTPLEVDCNIGDFSLSSIVNHIQNKYAPEEISEFSGMITSLTEPYCHLNNVLTQYRFIGLDEVLNNTTDTFELNVGFADFCGGDARVYSQSLILKRTMSSDSFQFDNVVKQASPLHCSHKFTFP